MTNRLTKEQIHELRTVDSATVANAIEKFHVRDPIEGDMGMDIRCQFPEFGVMVGYAVTATVDSTTSGRPLPPGEGHMRLFEAVASSPKPAVVILKDRSQRPSHSCLFGDVVAAVIHRLGAVGVVADGGVRDLEGIKPYGLQVFAPGIVVAHGTHTILDVNVPISLSGIPIRPGDLLHGDANGVTTVPLEIADQVYAKCLEVREGEKRIKDFAHSRAFSLEKLRERLLG